MDLLSARQKLVASNIANADTPGYHARDIDFQFEFRNAAGGEPRILEPGGLAARTVVERVCLFRGDKGKVAEVLVEIGTLLELKGENPFKTRAYSNAARALENLTEPLEKVVAEERLGEIPGIGEGIQKKVTELVTTGRLKYYEEIKASVPAGLVEMLQIPGMGPKKAKALNEKLGIESIEQLEAACKAGKVAELGLPVRPLAHLTGAS